MSKEAEVPRPPWALPVVSASSASGLPEEGRLEQGKERDFCPLLMPLLRPACSMRYYGSRFGTPCPQICLAQPGQWPRAL